MLILKSNGKEEKISFAKILNRIQKQNSLGELDLDLTYVIQTIYTKLFDRITSDEVENEIIETLAYKAIDDPKFDVLASRIFITRLHKRLPKFSLNFKKLFDNKLVDRKFYRFVRKHSHQLDAACDIQRDFQYSSIFSLYTFTKLYLLKHLQTGKVLESPQYLIMRVAINIGYLEGIEFVLQIYETMSQLKYTMASPTLFNACSKCPALASCFLLTLDDSIESIFENLKTVALISKEGGGIGIDFSRVRSQGCIVSSTNGKSLGIVPAMSVFNATSALVNQSGKRKGSFAMYLNPEHPDFLDFLELRTNVGNNENKARQLFYGIWASDTFMEYIRNPQYNTWYFIDPSTKEGKQLDALYGKEHLHAYNEIVQAKKYKGSIPTAEIWMRILNTQLETGNPYLCFRDAANQKNNLKHVAPIKSSNLCVAGSTLLLTDTGYYPMSELEGETVNAWNGYEFSQVTVYRTSEKASLRKIFFNNGLFIEVTAEHKFFVQTDHGIKKISAAEMKNGFLLELFDMPKITNERGEAQFDESNFDTVPFQGSQKQIEKYLLQHFRNTNKKRSHVEQMIAFILCQQLTGQKDVQAVVFRIDSHIREAPTFCATEPKRGRLTFNGIVTGNCSEIMLPASNTQHEIGTCNLASINLKAHVQNNQFNFESLRETARQLTRNLNHVIDVMKYAHQFSENSNKKHRPIGIGIQGLADVFYLLKMPFESEDAKALNKKIFEHIYYACYDESANLAEEFPEKIPVSFSNSPLSKGQFQFDLWEQSGHFNSSHLDLKKDVWDALREKIKKQGVLNMLMTCVMPTASTSQILGNYECIEPPMGIIFNRSTLSGNFPVINKYLVAELQRLDLWNSLTKQYIQKNASIQNLKSIPLSLRNIYKTVWEIDPATLVQLSIDRGPFIDHSQSLTLFFSGKNTKQKMTECFFKAFNGGLKTAVYYTRTKSAVLQNYGGKQEKDDMEMVTSSSPACSLENNSDCVMCSS